MYGVHFKLLYVAMQLTLFIYLNNGTTLFIFFNQKNMSHVSGRETRYLQALLWVSGSSRPSREEGLGLETGLGRGVRGGVCLWPPGTRSLLEVATTPHETRARNTEPWWPTLLSHLCQDSRGKGQMTLDCRCGSGGRVGVQLTLNVA